MKNLFMIRFILTSILFLILQYSTAQSTGVLRLLRGDMNIDLQDNRVETGLVHGKDESIDGKIYRLAFFSAVPNPQQRAKLQEAGVNILDYIPDMAYFLSIPISTSTEVLVQAGVIGLVRPDANISLHPDLAAGIYPDWSLPDNMHIDVMITFFNDIEENRINELLNSINIETLEEFPYHGIRAVRISRSFLFDLANHPFISYVEALYPPSLPDNYTGKTLHRSNVLNSELVSGRHYDGTGVHVMLQDDGIIGPHIDYTGRIGSQNLANNSGDHGDHVAGIIMGAGNLDPTLRGMAPGATIHTFGAASATPAYPGFVGMTNYYNSLNIRISSTSYSNGCNAGYTSLTRTMDQQIRTLPYLMHVFSAGNDGASDCSYGAGAGWGNITGGHKMAKNVISVANLNYTDALSNSSSRGPANDGRIKPEISAKGANVNSTTNPNLYTVKSGTSMSCPGVSGTLAQLYQGYRSLNGGLDPMGGLMKAILLNSADDIDNPGPDFKTGWGRINALRAMETMEANRYFVDTISQGDTNRHVIHIPDSIQELRVMVYWTDFEAFAGASVALVNNLDAVIIDTFGLVHLPWLLDHTPNPVNLNTPAGKGVDNLNNVEQIVINNPVPGNANLMITGKLVPQGPQEYFVVYEYLTDEIKVTYPLGGESFAPAEAISIRWDAIGASQNFILEYSDDDGQSWNLINNNINAARRYYDWTLPSIITGKMKVKLTRGLKSSVSEGAFSIMGIPTGLKVDWACKDTFQVSWNPVPGAEGYVIHKLGSYYMDSIDYSQTTSYLFTGVNEIQNYWWSVSAMGPNEAKGRRAIANEKVPGIWNCMFPYDLTVDVISPAPGSHPECIDHSAVPVKVKLKNVGKNAVSMIPVSFSLNYAGTITATYSDTLHPGTEVVFDLGQTINLPLPGNYIITAIVSHPLDSNFFNNTFTGRVKIVMGPSMTLGSLEDFEGFSVCSVLPECNYNCTLASGWVNEENGVMDAADWRTMQGITPTSGTGPIGDHTTNGGNGKFLYIEAAWDCYEKNAILVSPCLDLSQMPYPVLEFWYHMHGADMGSLHVDVLYDGEWIEDVISPISGNQGQVWMKEIVDLLPYSGKKIAVRFRGFTGPGQLSDIAIDDVRLMDATYIRNYSQDIFNVAVYPNPAQDQVHVRFSIDSDKTIQVLLYEISGRQVYSRTWKANAGQNDIELTLIGLHDGIYVLKLMTDNAIIHQKVHIRKGR